MTIKSIIIITTTRGVLSWLIEISVNDDILIQLSTAYQTFVNIKQKQKKPSSPVKDIFMTVARLLESRDILVKVV